MKIVSTKTIHYLKYSEQTPMWLSGIQDDNPKGRDFLRCKFYAMFPDIAAVQPREIIDFCVFTVTETGSQYIGWYDENFYLTTGGNGKSTKMGLEIGRLCASNVYKSVWDYDLDEEEFRIVYKTQ